MVASGMVMTTVNILLPPKTKKEMVANEDW